MGLRRHQIENLVLRGPIFYWRARIPVGFKAAGRNARLSLSLRLSDLKKASFVARRLNALLLQIEIVPKARMTTREQLTRIFAIEAEAMREEIEALDLSAKRLGTFRTTSGPGLTCCSLTSPFGGFLGRNPSKVQSGTMKWDERRCWEKER